MTSIEFSSLLALIPIIATFHPEVLSWFQDLWVAVVVKKDNGRKLAELITQLGVNRLSKVDAEEIVLQDWELETERGEASRCLAWLADNQSYYNKALHEFLFVLLGDAGVARVRKHFLAELKRDYVESCKKRGESVKDPDSWKGWGEFTNHEHARDMVDFLTKKPKLDWW